MRKQYDCEGNVIKQYDYCFSAYRGGVYMILEPRERASLVMKVCSRKGVAVIPPTKRTMGNGWLRKITLPTLNIDDSTGYRMRKYFRTVMAAAELTRKTCAHTCLDECGLCQCCGKEIDRN